MRAQWSGSAEPEYYRTRPTQLVPSADLGRSWVAVQGPDLRGWSVTDAQGERIGRVQDILVDTGTGMALFAIIAQGGLAGLGGKRTLVPLDALRLDEREQRAVFLPATSLLDEAPVYDPDQADYGAFYDYWAGRRPSGQQSAAAEQPLDAKRQEHRQPPARKVRIRILRREAGRVEEEEEEYTVSVSGDEIIIETGSDLTAEQVDEIRSRVEMERDEEEEEREDRRTA